VAVPTDDDVIAVMTVTRNGEIVHPSLSELVTTGAGGTL
jgi:hypothetical protein